MSDVLFWFATRFAKIAPAAKKDIRVDNFVARCLA
jgi:hypothetical protein